MNTYSNTLDKIILTARQQLESISAADFQHRPAPEKWSKQEILGHLIDSAYNNHQRFLRAEGQGNLVFSGYDQTAWVEKNAYQKREPQELVHTWATVHFHLSRLIAGLPEALLRTQTTEHNFHQISMNGIPEGVPIDLSYLIWDYIDHLEHHLAQLLPNYQRTNPPYEAPTQ